MIKTSIEKLSETIGFEIGMSDDVSQANLINGLCKALFNSMNDRQREVQLCYICDKLDHKSNKILIELVEFIKLKENIKT
jgi:hypothetical protein